MGDPERGEVWLADLGFAAKVRPVLVAISFGWRCKMAHLSHFLWKQRDA
jgi:hypothetical protein